MALLNTQPPLPQDGEDIDTARRNGAIAARCRFDNPAISRSHADMQRLPAIPAVMVLTALLNAPALAAGPNGECTCRAPGGDVVEGQTACLKTGKGMVLARCEKVLNNTSWKFLDQPCPVTQLTPASPQFMEALLSTAG